MECGESSIRIRRERVSRGHGVPSTIIGAELALKEAGAGSEELTLCAVAATKPDRVPLLPPSTLSCFQMAFFPHCPLPGSFLGLFFVSTVS